MIAISYFGTTLSTLTSSMQCFDKLNKLFKLNFNIKTEERPLHLLRIFSVAVSLNFRHYSMGVILSWSEIPLLTGNSPVLSPYNVQIIEQIND